MAEEEIKIEVPQETAEEPQEPAEEACAQEAPDAEPETAAAAEEEAREETGEEAQTGSEPESQDGQETEAEEPAEGGEEAPEGEQQGAEEEKKEEEDLQNRYLRLAADFQNFRRRTEKEKNDIYAYANEKIVLQLLDVIDNFERAMDSAKSFDQEQVESVKFAEGMELILRQLTDLLARNNVEEIKALGEPFDPSFHNAVMTEAVEEAESGTVTKVLQKGYTLNKKVIRPSMVAVAQ